jgi:membrane protein YdbS with pleckstrin-like domain
MADPVAPVPPASAGVTSAGGVTARAADGRLEITTERAGLRAPLVIRLVSAIVYIGFLAHWTTLLNFASSVLVAAFGVFWLLAAYMLVVAVGQMLRRWRISIENDELTVDTASLGPLRRITTAVRNVRVIGIDHYRGRGLQIAPPYYLRITVGDDPIELLTGFSQRELEFACALLRDRVEKTGSEVPAG